MENVSYSGGVHPGRVCVGGIWVAVYQSEEEPDLNITVSLCLFSVIDTDRHTLGD